MDDLPESESKYDYLYPRLEDPEFAKKITERKEFYDTRYDGTVGNVEELANKLCNMDFELAPHQMFVNNFLSSETPYNSLLLYHGLGSGKTCSAIGVAEEKRAYMKQMGITQRIMVIAAPNVQDNFRLQLFDERKLVEINGLWTIKSCAGNNFLREINPMSMKGLSKDKVIKQVRRIIDNSYLFMGYIEFANFIAKKMQVRAETLSESEIIKKSNAKLRKYFSNRLIIIDEVHNIRISDDKKEKRVALALYKLVKIVRKLRLLLLSATPMYNSYKEIVWLLNLMNINDNRDPVKINEIFNKDGTFKTSKEGEEIGKAKLMRKAIGYVSFVRGENPYTFPYRIWPKMFAKEKEFGVIPYPRIQLNGRALIQNMEVISLYLTSLGDYQQIGYNYIIERLQAGDFNVGNREMPDFSNMEAFGYTMLQRPLEALNIVYPDDRLGDADKKVDPRSLVGKAGLQRIMDITEGERIFQYKSDSTPRIFKLDNLRKYSGKMHDICESIMKSTGIVMVYSQYIDGGLVPLALALEELGFMRSSAHHDLFKKPPSDIKLDATTMQPGNLRSRTFKRAKYAMITGDKSLSPDNAEEMKLITSASNSRGHDVKVVLISQAAAEGLDFKFIRQVHVLEPWYNMNRIEQIIGRAVRTCSHKALPFKERNVQIYLHGSVMEDTNVEAADIYVYRLAELKAIQIGNVSRVLKECAADCILNASQRNFTEEIMDQIVEQRLSDGQTIQYPVGDKPYSVTCDYMKSCSYTCKPVAKIDSKDVRLDTFSEAFITMNNDKILQRIRDLFKEKHFYRKSELVSGINAARSYPRVQINASLTQLIGNNNEFITDKYGRYGTLKNIGDLYLFQPIELNDPYVSIKDRITPIEYKRPFVRINTAELKLDSSAVPSAAPSAAPSATSSAVPSAAPTVPLIDPAKSASKITLKKSSLSKKDNELHVNEVFSTIKKNYELALSTVEIKRGQSNWYSRFSRARIILNKLGVSNDLLNKFILQHIVDELLFSDKMKLLNSSEIIKDPLYDSLILYIKQNTLNGEDGLQGIILQEQGDLQIVVKRGEENWVKAEPEDYIELKPLISSLLEKYLPSDKILARFVGFIMDFKKKYRIFKVKDMFKPRHRGARCDQAGKGQSLRMLYDILLDDIDIPLNKEHQIVICILQEMFLRLYDEQKREERRWFLTPGIAALIKIETMRHSS